MRYLPLTPSDRAEMLGVIGAMIALPSPVVLGQQSRPLPRVAYLHPGSAEGSAVYKALIDHSTTRSVRIRISCGRVTPRRLAVFWFTMSSNLVGCSTGRFAGLLPFRILSM